MLVTMSFFVFRYVYADDARHKLQVCKLSFLHGNGSFLPRSPASRSISQVDSYYYLSALPQTGAEPLCFFLCLHHRLRNQIGSHQRTPWRRSHAHRCILSQPPPKRLLRFSLQHDSASDESEKRNGNGSQDRWHQRTRGGA